MSFNCSTYHYPIQNFRENIIPNAVCIYVQRANLALLINCCLSLDSVANMLFASQSCKIRFLNFFVSHSLKVLAFHIFVIHCSYDCESSQCKVLKVRKSEFRKPLHYTIKADLLAKTSLHDEQSFQSWHKKTSCAVNGSNCYQTAKQGTTS